VQPPIACALGSGDQRVRVDEWREFFRASVLAVEDCGEGRARFRLKAPSQDLIAAADLARREIECCGFFSFSIEIETEGCWLVAEVPAEATQVLDGFVELARSSG
jgi:hypothetical protein